MSVFLNPAEGRLRAGWRLLLFGIGTLVAALAAGWIRSLDAGSLYWRQAAAAAGGALLLAAAAWVQARWVDRRPFADFGLFRGPEWMGRFLFGLALGAILLGALFGVEWAAGWIRIKPPAARVGAGADPAVLVAQLIQCAGIALVWELAFRGCVLRNLAEGFRSEQTGPDRAVVLAWLASAGIVGVFQFLEEFTTPLGILNAAVAALVGGVAVVWTRSLALPLGFAIAWRFVQGPVLGFPDRGSHAGNTVMDIALGGPVVLAGGTYGPEGGLLATLALALGALGFWCWIRWRDGSVKVQAALSEYHGQPGEGRRSVVPE
ncbi:MAG: CPBP family intramembrane metalloprotease [Verrucomicrobiae bacterium]|nr:CPBP family intramembrane metalloprotease [Verrucomicrobiae bacterium]